MDQHLKASIIESGTEVLNKLQLLFLSALVSKALPQTSERDFFWR